MADETDLASRDPFEVRLGTGETGGEFVRFAFTLYPPPEETPPDLALPHERWAIDAPFGKVEHVHPEQSEWWKVLSGELVVTFDGEEHTLTEGDEIEIPADTPQQHYNPAREPARVLFERRPALGTEPWAETLYTLAQVGETKPDGTLRFPQLVTVVDEYPNTFLTTLPVGVQRGLFGLLAPVFRWAGYEPTHTRSEIPQQRRVGGDTAD